MLEVAIFNPTEMVFKGRAKSVILPGENGFLEILPFHKRMVSRLITGEITVDGRTFPIFRGLMQINDNRVVVVAEQEPPGQQKP